MSFCPGSSPWDREETMLSQADHILRWPTSWMGTLRLRGEQLLSPSTAGGQTSRVLLSSEPAVPLPSILLPHTPGLPCSLASPSLGLWQGPGRVLAMRSRGFQSWMEDTVGS